MEDHNTNIKPLACVLPSNLVAELLAGNDGDLLTHTLVGVEVIAQTGVVLLDDDPSGLLYRLGPDTSLQCNENKVLPRYNMEYDSIITMTNKTVI